MITNGFLGLGYLIFHWIIGLFPVSSGYPPEVVNAMSSI